MNGTPHEKCYKQTGSPWRGTRQSVGTRVDAEEEWGPLWASLVAICIGLIVLSMPSPSAIRREKGAKGRPQGSPLHVHVHRRPYRSAAQGLCVPYKRIERRDMQEATGICPISTNFRATHFSDSNKYANMGNSKHSECAIIHTILMLLKALIVRSTTQKDISLSVPQERKCCAARRCLAITCMERSSW